MLSAGVLQKQRLRQTSLRARRTSRPAAVLHLPWVVGECGARGDEHHRTAWYERVGLLITHQFAALPDTLARDSGNRPTNLTATLAWARQILAGREAAQTSCAASARH